jgi:8-oxo-dGTP diphosphatase
VDDAADYTSTLPEKRMAAGVLLFDGSGRVLLVEPTYKQGWEFPGGVVMADESPWSAAVREVKEELGLVLPGPLRLLVTDWVPPRDRRTECVVVLFDGGQLGVAEVAAIRLPANELRSFRFVSEAEAVGLLPPIRARRLRAALAVRACGSRLGYLEDGRPLG